MSRGIPSHPRPGWRGITHPAQALASWPGRGRVGIPPGTRLRLGVDGRGPQAPKTKEKRGRTPTPCKQSCALIRKMGGFLRPLGRRLVFLGQHNGQYPASLFRIGRIFTAFGQALVVIVNLPEDFHALVGESPEVATPILTSLIFSSIFTFVLRQV